MCVCVRRLLAPWLAKLNSTFLLLPLTPPLTRSYSLHLPPPPSLISRCRDYLRRTAWTCICVDPISAPPPLLPIPLSLQLVRPSQLRSLVLKLYQIPFPSSPLPSPFLPLSPHQLARLPQLRSLDLQQGLAGGVPELYVPALCRLAPLTALTRLQLRVVYGGPSGGLRVRRDWGGGDSVRRYGIAKRS